jgi:RNA polymerase sigma factor (sigma-70 family)
MDSPGSVTCWLDGLRLGDGAAAQQLWEKYFVRLVELARRKLRGRKPHSADEEDIALSAFNSFCFGAEQGRFPKLADRHDLWQILVMIAARKAANLLRHERAAKRGGQVIHEANGRDASDRLADIVGNDPSPSFAAQVAEEYYRLVDELDDDLRRIAQLKMEGLTDKRIAKLIGCSQATVERKLRLIRRLWQGELPDAE